MRRPTGPDGRDVENILKTQRRKPTWPSDGTVCHSSVPWMRPPLRRDCGPCPSTACCAAEGGAAPALHGQLRRGGRRSAAARIHGQLRCRGRRSSSSRTPALKSSSWTSLNPDIRNHRTHAAPTASENRVVFLWFPERLALALINE